jgi:pimeloyl-ACP methyl ester carboxylesterase
MIWIVTAGLLVVAALLSVAALAHRALLRRRIAAALRIRGPRGIEEEGFVPIGGIDQWIGMRGEDGDNPVLLVIHGGPGASCSIFTPRIQCWERNLIVVQWDQRGSGKTLGRCGVRGTGELTLDRLIRDGIEVAEHLRARLRKQRIILLAASFGSTFGLSMVRRRPDLFSAYVGTDQSVGVVRDREATHRATLERLRTIGLKKGVAALEKIGPDPSSWTAKDYTSIARWTMKSDPRTCKRIMELLKSAIWFSPGHTLRDIRDFVAGMELSIARLFPEVPAYDAWQEWTHFEVPFFVFQGERDVLTPPALAQAFFDDVTAPVKGFALICAAGHFAAFTHPEQFLYHLLTQVRPMAVEAPSAPGPGPSHFTSVVPRIEQA